MYMDYISHSGYGLKPSTVVGDYNGMCYLMSTMIDGSNAWIGYMRKVIHIYIFLSRTYSSKYKLPSCLPASNTLSPPSTKLTLLAQYNDLDSSRDSHCMTYQDVNLYVTSFPNVL